MIKKTVLFIFLLTVCGFSFGQTLNWQAIEEKAQILTLDQAQKNLEKAPLDLEALYCLGLKYLKADQLDLAQNIFLKLRNLYPEYIEISWGEAELLRRANRLGDSEMLLNDIIEERFDFVPAYISLAYLDFSSRKFSETENVLKRVLSFDATKITAQRKAEAQLLFAATCGMLAHYNEMFAGKDLGVNFSFAQSQEILPYAAPVYFGLGVYWLLVKSGPARLDVAKDFFEQTIALDPHLADAYARLAQIYQARGNLEKTNEYLNKALAVDPQNFLAADIRSGRCAKLDL